MTTHVNLIGRTPIRALRSNRRCRKHRDRLPQVVAALKPVVNDSARCQVTRASGSSRPSEIARRRVNHQWTRRENPASLSSRCHRLSRRRGKAEWPNNWEKCTARPAHHPRRPLNYHRRVRRSKYLWNSARWWEILYYRSATVTVHFCYFITTETNQSSSPAVIFLGIRATHCRDVHEYRRSERSRRHWYLQGARQYCSDFTTYRERQQRLWEHKLAGTFDNVAIRMSNFAWLIVFF